MIQYNAVPLVSWRQHFDRRRKRIERGELTEEDIREALTIWRRYPRFFGEIQERSASDEETATTTFALNLYHQAAALQLVSLCRQYKIVNASAIHLSAQTCRDLFHDNPEFNKPKAAMPSGWKRTETGGYVNTNQPMSTEEIFRELFKPTPPASESEPVVFNYWPENLISRLQDDDRRIARDAQGAHTELAIAIDSDPDRDTKIAASRLPASPPRPTNTPDLHGQRPIEPDDEFHAHTILGIAIEGTKVTGGTKVPSERTVQNWKKPGGGLRCVKRGRIWVCSKSDFAVLNSANASTK